MGNEQELKKKRDGLDEPELRFLGALGSGNSHPGGFYADSPHQSSSPKPMSTAKSIEYALSFIK